MSRANMQAKSTKYKYTECKDCLCQGQICKPKAQSTSTQSAKTACHYCRSNCVADMPKRRQVGKIALAMHMHV